MSFNHSSQVNLYINSRRKSFTVCLAVFQSQSVSQSQSQSVTIGLELEWFEEEEEWIGIGYTFFFPSVALFHRSLFTKNPSCSVPRTVFFFACFYILFILLKSDTFFVTLERNWNRDSFFFHFSLSHHSQRSLCRVFFFSSKHRQKYRMVEGIIYKKVRVGKRRRKKNLNQNPLKRRRNMIFEEFVYESISKSSSSSSSSKLDAHNFIKFIHFSVLKYW